MNGQLLGDFAAWLVSLGYARHAAQGHVRRLKQTLEGVSVSPIAGEVGIAATSLSEAFRLPAAQSLFQGTRGHLSASSRHEGSF